MLIAITIKALPRKPYPRMKDKLLLSPLDFRNFNEKKKKNNSMILYSLFKLVLMTNLYEKVEETGNLFRGYKTPTRFYPLFLGIIKPI